MLSIVQSESSIEEMTCITEFLDKKEAMEPQAWGGPAEFKSLLDDGVAPGPGEEEDEQRTEEIFRRRILLLEETVVRRGKGGGNQEKDSLGGKGQRGDESGFGGW